MRHIYKTITRYSDVDQMGIVHNARYQTYFEEARIDLVRSLGYPYARMEEEGFFYPVSEAKINYHQSIFYDDEITVEVWLEYLKTFSIKFCYHITKGTDKQSCCSGYTIHASIDKVSKDFTPIPERIQQVLLPFIERKR
ncbi:MAG: acyl-CoA thioesterase [Spirochaetes bacterium]|nr:acyl-CoA thioesterase [Spirochaetota bacterium]